MMDVLVRRNKLTNFESAQQLNSHIYKGCMPACLQPALKFLEGRVVEAYVFVENHK